MDFVLVKNYPGVCVFEMLERKIMTQSVSVWD